MTPGAGAPPLDPRRRWQTITVATLLLVPGYWALLAGLVAEATDAPDGAPDVAGGLALGLALLPFVFVVLAFMSGHPRAPQAVLKAMGLCLLAGIPASALAGDAVTGIVVGVGAGGSAALRGPPDARGARAFAVVIAGVYTFVLVRTLGAVALLPAPVFPLTAIGLADHLVERRAAAAV